MKIVFFSDAHGNQYTVKKLFSQLKAEKPDLIIFGGDVFGYYYGQREILTTFWNEKCICLLGNHDKHFLELLEGKIDEKYLVERYGATYRDITKRVPDKYIDYLYTWDRWYDLVAGNLHLVFVHGSIMDPLNGRVYPDAHIADIEPYMGYDYVFMGHTHHKMAVKLANGTVLINPGSIGQQRDGSGCTYVVFDTEQRNWIFKEIKYDRSLLVTEIKRNNETSEMEQRLVEVLYRNKA